MVHHEERSKYNQVSRAQKFPDATTREAKATIGDRSFRVAVVENPSGANYIAYPTGWVRLNPRRKA